MKQEHWQAAFWLAMSILVLTNVAQFYSRRVAAAEAVSTLCPTFAAPTREAQIVVGPMEREQTSSRSMAPQPLQSGERCISGQKFRKVGNEWLQLAASC